MILLPLLLFITGVIGDNFPVDLDVDIGDLTKSTDERYRLPEVLDPIHYDVEITPYFEAEKNKEKLTFDGKVTINVKVSIFFYIIFFILAQTLKGFKKWTYIFRFIAYLLYIFFIVI